MKKRAIKETATTLEELVKVADSRRLRVNNLHQFDGSWRTNVNDRKQFYEFGESKTALRHFKPHARKGKERGPMTRELTTAYYIKQNHARRFEALDRPFLRRCASRPKWAWVHFSLGRGTTHEEIEAVVERLNGALAVAS